MNRTERPARQRYVAPLLRLGALAALALLWQLASLALDTPVFPPPSRVLALFITELPGPLGWHFAASLWRVTAKHPPGHCDSGSRRPRAGPEQAALRSYGALHLAPTSDSESRVGPCHSSRPRRGELPKIVIVATILFFQILVLVRDAAAAIQTELLTSVRSLGAGRRALLTFVYLPASLPAIFTAVRQSIGTAVASSLCC